MKKIMLLLLCLAVLFVGVLFVAGDKVISTIKKSGTEEYYVQIHGEGETSDNRRVYTLKGYDKEGKEKELSFDSLEARQLREGAYLRLYVEGEDQVKTYEEVQKNDLPASIREKFQP
ncbi:YxeA family protein [Desmospora profundinema]|uniref:Uncharacterized protein (TIGR01655 family) n=1 Tax=Desmospora profundinema TaxID=1571184 RepID=A0ABU1IIP5_9BACL|nr:YxeA family protein [Desmospora profundinema]MDR6224422.1 uncharacterized protein (TIGR01655 family) [Desmospora profundinema]